MWFCASPEAYRVSRVSQWAAVPLLLLVIMLKTNSSNNAAPTGGCLPVMGALREILFVVVYLI